MTKLENLIWKNPAVEETDKELIDMPNYMYDPCLLICCRQGTSPPYHGYTPSNLGTPCK